MFNRIVAAGARIEEDMEAAPRLDMFKLALETCGPSFRLIQLSPENLLVSAGEFKAYIPCLPAERLIEPIPDAPCAVVTDDVTRALRVVGTLADVKGKTVLESAVQLNAGSAVATDNHIMLEAWHGIDLPNGMLIPKQAIQVLAKIKKVLVNMGFSRTSATFWFEDGSWMRTNIFNEGYPNVGSILRYNGEPRPVPSELFSAAKQIAPFSLMGEVFIKNGYMTSHPDNMTNVGSTLKLSIEGEHAPRIYDADNLKLISKLVQTWDETYNEQITYFFGENVRGAIYCRPYTEIDDGSDIPF